MFVDVDCTQEKKYNQNTFGDYFVFKRYPETGRLIAVLSDGLGSGVKANILACMTSTMLLKFIEAQSNIQKACEIILNSLPVCKVRKISYSTFSAFDCDDEGNAKIVEEGNPQFVWIRDGSVLEPECKIITSETFSSRKMHIYELKLEKHDRLIFCSDGATQAGLGSKQFRLGLKRDGFIKLIQEELKKNPTISSRELSKRLVKAVLLAEPDRNAKDDVSVLSVYCRDPRNSIVFTGPPYKNEKDNVYANTFYKFNGKKAVCGGTTANLISRELGIPLRTDMQMIAGKLPGVSYMEGIDLVTEGILTLTKTAEYLENGYSERDAAGELMKFLLDSDCITFMVGAKINQAHYDPAFPIEIEIRKNIIKKMKQVLEEKYIKKVMIQYM